MFVLGDMNECCDFKMAVLVIGQLLDEGKITLDFATWSSRSQGY